MGTNIFLGLWTAGSIQSFTQGEYMAIYAALGEIVLQKSTLCLTFRHNTGVAQAIFSFALSFAFALRAHHLRFLAEP